MIYCILRKWLKSESVLSCTLVIMTSKPNEVSSKKPVSVLRQTFAPIRPKPVDPRFNRAFGEFNEESFKHSYGFIKEIQERERATLQNALKTEKDPHKREHIQRVLDRQQSIAKAKEKEDFRNAVMQKWKKNEKEMVKQGKKPFFLKRADQKKLELIAKFKEMKERAAANGQSVNVDKLMEKRRKHKSSKQRTQLPPRDFNKQ